LNGGLGVGHFPDFVAISKNQKVDKKLTFFSQKLPFLSRRFAIETISANGFFWKTFCGNCLPLAGGKH
jgi:hypothetical protein